MDIYIARGEEQLGPYPLDQVQQLLDSGVLKPDDFAFHEGLENWTPLPEVIAAQASALPPLPALPKPQTAAPEPAPPVEPAAESPPADPLAQPSAASTPDKPKKGVPAWLRILVWVLFLGLIAAGVGGYSIWYLFYKPDPLEMEPLLEEMEPGVPQGSGQSNTSGNQNTDPSGETANSLAETIVGKRLVCQVFGTREALIQFEKDGTFNVANVLADKIQPRNDGSTYTYTVEGLKAKILRDGDDGGAVSFPSATLKKGDKISMGQGQMQLNGTLLRIEPAAPFVASTNTTQPTEPNDPDNDSLAELKQAAEKGYSGAQYQLGLKYLTGEDGLKKKPELAGKWLLRASNQGNANAQYSLGNMLFSGKDRPKDLQQAAHWTKLAARTNPNQAQFKGLLDRILKQATPAQVKQAEASVAAFKPQAEILFSKIKQFAEAGDPRAQTILGYKYIMAQEGLKKDPVMAEKWWLRAAKQGWPMAQNNLSILYSSGRARPKDLVQAYYWANLADQDGIQRAKQTMAKIRGEATPAQIKDAQALVQAFKPVTENSEGTQPKPTKPDPKLIAQGKILFQTKICFTCHQTDPKVPTPAGLALKSPNFMGDFWGKEREVHKGLGGPIETFIFDEAYFTQQIRRPMDWVLKGALAPMPPGPPINDEELKALIAYVKSLSKSEPSLADKKLTPAQVENILAQEIGSWKVKGNITTLDPKTGTGEAKEFEDKMETRWKEKGKSTISSFGSGMGQNLTGTTVYDSEMEWFVWRVQGEGRPETVSKNIYDPTTKTYHQLLMLPNDHVERGTFKRINKDEAILKSEVFNAGNEVVATHEINFTRIDSDVTEPNEPDPNTPTKKPGTVLWEFVTGGEVKSSPAIGADGTVYVGSNDNKLYAINPKSGEKKWEFETGGLVHSSPAIGADGTVYVGSHDNKLYALSGKSGVKLWEFETGGGVYSPAIGSDGTLYVGSLDKKLYAINGKTGEKLWEFETGTGEISSGVRSSPAIGADGTVYVGSNDNKLYAINPKNGVKLWEFKTGGLVGSSPAIGADGTIYVGSYDKKLYALSGKSGEKKWEFETGGVVQSSPAIGADGTVYVGSGYPDKKLYALSGKTGVKQWEFETGGIVWSSPAIGPDGTVYVGSNEYKLYAINGKSGVKLWEFETGNEVYSSPAIGTGGTLYIGSSDKKLYAFRTDSKGLAKSPWPMRGQNAQRTGRAVNTATEPTEPIEKKLSSAEVEKILAAQIGQWQVKGQLKPANEEPIAYEFTLNVQWKEKGKSISSTGTLEKAGEKISLFSSKEYDPSKGVFAFRFRQGLRPEVLSHEQYNPATQTFQGRQISPEEPEVTYTFQADGPDKFIFKMKTTRNGQLLSTDESIQTRIATTVTEPANPEPTSGGDDKSAKIIEAAIRKASNKPTGELTKADYEKVALLDLVSKKLTDVKGLEKLTQLTRLILRYNQLTDVSGLENLTQLTNLNLQHNELTDVKGLEKLTQLTYLNLSNNKLTDVKGLEKLTQLTRLDLTGNPDLTKAQIVELKKALPRCGIDPLTEEESAEIIQAAIRKAAKKPTGELTQADFEKVTKLNLESKKLTDVSGLEKLTQLTYLNLQHNELTDVKGLEKLTQLTRLRLRYNQLTDVSGLENLTQLEDLGLRNNQLTDVKGLEKLTQLTNLSLSYNKLTDVSGLENLTQLTSLGLGYNNLTDVKGLEKLTQLKDLWLGYNKLTDVSGLENLTQLPKLGLSDNKLTDVKGLEKLTQLTSLTLNRNPLTNVKGLENLTQLTELYLSQNQLTDVKGLENLTQLRELSLSENKLTDVSGLEKLTQLTSLSLAGNRLTDVNGLENLTQLWRLDLSENKLTNVKGLENLTQSRLSLDLTGNPDLTKAQIVELKKALPRCEIYPLTKEESAEIIEAAIRKAAKKPEGELTKADFEKVTNLSVSLKQLTDVTGLEKLTQLTNLNIWGNQLTNVKGLEELYQLTNLNIMQNKLTDVSGLENLTQLTSLMLIDNPDLTKAQIDQLQKALPNCNIISNPKPTSGGDDKSAKIIEAAIRKAAKKPEGELTKADYEKVKTVVLNDLQLTDVKGLEKLTNLKVLYLSRNKLTDVKGLEKLTQLKELYLNNNQLTSAKGLEKLTQLEGLVLGDNPDLTKAQIDQLQKALPKCIILSNPTK